MALDLKLLAESARSGVRSLRLYCWDPPTLSIGRNQAIETIDHRMIPIIRRPTGGKAVWHEQELTYAVAAPISVFGSLRMAYRAIHTRLAAALQAMGVDAVLASRRPTVRLSDGPTSCFAASAGGEILARGRKIVGSAQVRRGNTLLQHGSILIDGSQPSAVGGATTLSAILGRNVSFGEVAAAVIAAWGEPLVPTDSPTVRPSDAFGGLASVAAE